MQVCPKLFSGHGNQIEEKEKNVSFQQTPERLRRKWWKTDYHFHSVIIIKHSDGSIMLWECFTSSCSGELAKTDGTEHKLSLSKLLILRRVSIIKYCISIQY